MLKANHGIVTCIFFSLNSFYLRELSMSKEFDFLDTYEYFFFFFVIDNIDNIDSIMMCANEI